MYLDSKREPSKTRISQRLSCYANVNAETWTTNLILNFIKTLHWPNLSSLSGDCKNYTHLQTPFNLFLG